MNIFSGIIRFDGAPIEREKLAAGAFNTPHWQPDHEALLIDEQTGFMTRQRFITPTAHKGLMPYTDAEPGYTIIANSYLTYRKELSDKLEVSDQLADCQLILLAYLQWGRACTQHLTGNFSFIIWHAREQKVFLAADHFATRPLFYTYQPNQYLIFANTIEPFRHLCSKLIIDEDTMARSALDVFSIESTCYQEIKKIKPAHQLIITKERMTKERYWKLGRKKWFTRKKTREEYYEEFRELFEGNVRECLNTDYPIMSHISGGLDSSSVTAMAAKLLAEENKKLYGFTAIPKELSGPSYRKGWYYHEMPIVQTVLDQYPNIEHYLYQTDLDRDPLQLVQVFYPFIDQPYRDVFNLDWVLRAFEKGHDVSSRIILGGQQGNATISYAGCNLRETVSKLYHNQKIKFNLHKYIIDRYYKYYNINFLSKSKNKKSFKERHIINNFQKFMLNMKIPSSLAGNASVMFYWYGMEHLDPTNDIKLKIFCNNLPQWVYRKKSGKLERKLLVREGMRNILPEALRMNMHKGEQAADWYLQYNRYALNWKNQHAQFSNTVKDILWKFYDKNTGVFDSFSLADHEKMDLEEVWKIRLTGLRCFNLGHYLNYLTLSI